MEVFFLEVKVQETLSEEFVVIMDFFEVNNVFSQIRVIRIPEHEADFDVRLVEELIDCWFYR